MSSKLISDKFLKATEIDIQNYITPMFEDANKGIRSVFKEINAPDGVAESMKYTGMYEGGFEMPRSKNIGDPTPIVDKVGGYDFEINYTWYDMAYVYDYMDKKSALKRLEKIVEDKARFAEAFETRIAQDCADLFNNGKTYQSPDNVALFSTSHPIVEDKGFGYGTTFSNLRSSSALNYDNFNDACIEFENDFLQTHGDKALQKPSTILIPNVLSREALKIQKAVNNPENANNEPSVASRLTVVQCGRLKTETVKSNSSWYLLDDKGNNPFRLVWRLKPTMILIDEPLNNRVIVKTQMIYGVGVESPYACQRNDA